MPRNTAFILLCVPFFNILGTLAMPTTVERDLSHIVLQESHFQLDERGFHYVDLVPHPLNPRYLIPDLTPRQSPNPNHVLSKRVGGVPDKPLCHTGDQWQGRYCNYRRSIRSWDDHCRDNRIRYSYTVPGLCPENTFCVLNRRTGVTGTGVQDIECLALVKEADGVVSTKEYIERVTDFDAIFGKDKSQQRSISLELTHSRDQASVSAFLEGMNGQYPVTAHADLVGSYRGHGGQQVCSYDRSLLACKPTGVFHFRGGDFIDFTFGLIIGQAVRLYYSLVGKVGK